MTSNPLKQAEGSEEPPLKYVLRLYLSSAAPLSARAVVNTRAFCEKFLAGKYELEILSIAEHVKLAMEDQVIAAPALIKLKPLPPRKFIGDMSNSARLLEGMGLLGAV